MLPIGVVLPTRNAASLLPGHLSAMRQWLDQVQEIVVVDSFSKDGTIELLRAELRHPRLKFLEHPPGLYQSWNYGICNVQAEYCYISTVGESITAAGLQHLAETLTSFKADVVISRPNFIDLSGRPMKSPRWPIEDIISSLRMECPRLLSGAALFLFSLVHYRNAILGSSASNLFRTSCLRQFPFPVEFGTVGDGAWELQHCLKIQLAVTPQVFSTFREHPKSYSSAEYKVDELASKLLRLISRTYAEEISGNLEFAKSAHQLQIDQLLKVLEQQLEYQQQLEHSRHAGYPWIFSPSAWNARRGRNACARKTARLKIAALQLLFPESRL